jgi:hypothetical protein
MKIEQKSDLKNKLQGLNRLEFYFFHIFGKFKLHFSL